VHGRLRTPLLDRGDKLSLEQIPLGKLRAGSRAGRNDKLSLKQVPPLRSCFALGSNCSDRDDRLNRVGGRKDVAQWWFLEEGGATLVEFAITLPILVMILYAIFDFGSALVLKQKLEHVVYEAARAAASQSTDDLSNTLVGTAGSVADLRDTVARNLQGAGVNDCGLLGAATSADPPPAATWTYSVSGGGCPAPLVLTIRRGDVLAVGAVRVFVSRVTLQYPFQYRSAGILKVVAPGSSFPTSTNLVVDASMKNLL
jgi:Flp pilus assembly protein TadG